MLLAKSPPKHGTPKPLREHCTDVADAAEALYGSAEGPTELGSAWLRLFRVDSADWPTFHANLLAVALLHDLGKANDGFQQAVRGESDKQVLRHEHLSALILARPEFVAWLGGNPLLRPALVVSAVASHHLKAAPKAPRKASYPDFAAPLNVAWGNRIRIQEPEEVARLLADAAERLSLATPPRVPTRWSLKGPPGEDVDEARERVLALLKPFDREVRGKSGLAVAVKAALVAADGAGSALPREGHRIADWIGAAFGVPPLTRADVEDRVIARRIAEVTALRRHHDPNFAFEYRDFQLRAAELPARSLLLAACAAGKTLAAWRWIAAQADARPIRRVLFLYPTRATATEGFRDYVSHAPEEDAALLSGTAAYELQDMFENPDDARSGRNYETEARLFAVGAWRKRVFSATVDQFLGFMQQAYGSLCLLPVLAESAVVVDEVHSFDEGMFSTLRRFLEAFDVPVLCMTASLPAGRRNALCEWLHPYPDADTALSDLDRLAAQSRYRAAALAGREEAEERARQAFAAGKSVLWVVNTVDRCQEVARALSDLDPLCYHSRFKLEHRNARHRAVVAAFQTGSGPRISVTTQVCEMSLDLDADVLITEYAPITALIQRMGRCNRRLHLPFGEVWCYPPDGAAPYRQAALDLATRFIADLAGPDPVSQRDLEERLEHYSRMDRADGERIAAFLDHGAWAKGGAEELRDGVDYTVPAVLDDEIDAFRALQKAGEATDGLILPVPRRAAGHDDRLPRFLHSAPSERYDPILGFTEGETTP